MAKKANFYKPIYEYYDKIAGNKIPGELLKGLTDKINEYYSEQYTRLAIQCPKSAKRYTSFQLTDLEHPKTYEIVIKFFKDNLGSNYHQHTETVLKMNSSALNAFEKSREDFHNMF